MNTVGPNQFKHLRGLGENSYNGVYFDERSNFSVQQYPVQDKAQRTIVYDRYAIKVTGWASDPTSTDPLMNQVRDKLRAQGGRLCLNGKGYGTFLVNDPS